MQKDSYVAKIWDSKLDHLDWELTLSTAVHLKQVETLTQLQKAEPSEDWGSQTTLCSEKQELGEGSLLGGTGAELKQVRDVAAAGVMGRSHSSFSATLPVCLFLFVYL